MTVSSENTHEFTILRLIYQAHRLALLVPPGAQLTQTQQTEGAEALQLVMSELPGDAIRLRQVRYDYLTLTADSEWLTLPEDVFDVGVTAMYIPAGTGNVQQADSETPVRREYREEFQRRGGKGATSATPTLFRLDQEQVPFQLELWPIPNEAGTLRVESYRLAANSTDPNKTADAGRHFARTLVYGMAAHLATGGAADLARVQYLEGRFETLKKKALNQSKDVAPRRFVIKHRTPWS